MKKANYTVEGRVYKIYNVEEIELPTKTLLKRTIVIEVPVEKGSWDRTNFAAFDLFGNSVYTLDNFSEGNDVIVAFRIKSNQGKKDETKWFTSLYIDDIERIYYQPTDNKLITPTAEDDFSDILDTSSIIPKEPEPTDKYGDVFPEADIKELNRFDPSNFNDLPF